MRRDGVLRCHNQLASQSIHESNGIGVVRICLDDDFLGVTDHLEGDGGMVGFGQPVDAVIIKILIGERTGFFGIYQKVHISIGGLPGDDGTASGKEDRQVFNGARYRKFTPVIDTEVLGSKQVIGS